MNHREQLDKAYARLAKGNAMVEEANQEIDEIIKVLQGSDATASGSNAKEKPSEKECFLLDVMDKGRGRLKTRVLREALMKKYPGTHKATALKILTQLAARGLVRRHVGETRREGHKWELVRALD